MGWVLRVFQSGQRSLMLTLLKSLFIPLIEYCYQLWNPRKSKDIQAIETIQRTFTHKITEVLLGKTARTQIMLSPQTPWTLYNYIYLEDNSAYGAKYWWTMGHKIKTRKHPRHGRQCVIQYPTNRNTAQSLQENEITVFGPRLYNSLPTEFTTSFSQNVP